MSLPKIKIAVWASGAGTNAAALMQYFQDHSRIEIAAVFYNRKQAGVVDKANMHHIPAYYFSNTDFEFGDVVLVKHRELEIDCIVLAGFLRKVPLLIIDAYKHRITNLHPALLPKYGGKGMFGNRVHEAVLAAGETQSGITIHEVNAQYDEGKIIAQFRCEVLPEDTPELLASRIHALEHAHLPQVIAQWILG